MAGLTTTDELMGGLNSASAEAPTPDLTADLDKIESKTVAATPQSAYEKSLDDLRIGRAQLDQQIQKLKQGLDKRSQMPFDPMWMKIAAGLLKPTKTGSFAESAGYAAENAADAAIAEQKRLEDVEKLKLDLELKGLESKQAAAQMEDFLGYSQPAQLKPAVTTGARGEIVSNEIPRVASAVSTRPGTIRKITDADISRAYALGEKHGDKVAAIAKAQREEFASSNAPVTIQLPNGAEYKTTAANADTYNNAVRESIEKNDPSIINDALRKIGAIAPTYRSQTEGATKEATKETSLTLPESPAEKAGKEEESKIYGKGSAELATQLQLSGTGANDLRNAADAAISISKSNPKAFKLLENAEIRDSYNKFISAAQIGTPWGSFSLPKETIAKFGLDHNDILALQQMAQIEAQMTVMNRRTWLKGQGQVSDNESAMVAMLGPQHSDDPAVIRMKSEAIKLKADFEERAYEAWVDYHEKGGSFSKFLVSPEYKAAKNDYNKRLGMALEANARYLSGERNPTSGTQNTSPGGFKTKTLVEQLNEAS